MTSWAAPFGVLFQRQLCFISGKEMAWCLQKLLNDQLSRLWEKRYH